MIKVNTQYIKHNKGVFNVSVRSDEVKIVIKGDKESSPHVVDTSCKKLVSVDLPIYVVQLLDTIEEYLGNEEGFCCWPSYMKDI